MFTNALRVSTMLLWFLVVQSSVRVPGTGAQEELAQLSGSLESLVDRVGPGVVQIFVSGYSGQGGIVEGTADLLSRQRGMGSGIILDSDGYIVTNAHVVSGARRVQVRITRGLTGNTEQGSILTAPGELLGAQVVGIDTETDLAVLKVARKGLPHLQLADSDAVRAGQLVFAFGSPLGLENSVTMGIVSSAARQLRQEDPMIYIQTDAPINPGNSGGPLVDAQGNVIGVNTMIFSRSGGSEGIGFAAPSNIVRTVYEQLRATGTVRRGIIGVQAQTINHLLATALQLRRERGVILGDVLPGSPAEKAGLEVGDVVVTLDGKPMENARQFDVNLYQRRAGQQVKLEIERRGEARTVQVEVAERPDVTRSLQPLVTPETNLVPDLGILALDVTPEISKLLPPLRQSHGVVVVGRAAEAPYLDLGILPGDVIHQINDKPVLHLSDLRQELSKLRAYDAVVLQVERQGVFRFVTFEFE